MEDALHIAQVAPLIEAVPPKKYGGTERVVSWLTAGLVDAGHRVTLCATGDSQTRADLLAAIPEGLRATGESDAAVPLHLAMLEQVYRRADEFDIIHAHLDHLTFPFARRSSTPTVTTMHGRLDLPRLPELYREYDDMPLISISRAQRRPLPPETWWAGNIYHGLPVDHFDPNYETGDYLAFLGRVSPEKRVDAAIRVALEAGYPLKIAAKVDDNDRAYFESEIEPMLGDPLIEFVGEIDERHKQSFLAEAAALVFMVDWPEPFGLAMIEAMACGTPVIARRCGSIPEVVDEGVTGFVCDHESGAIEAVRRLDALDRHACRRRFEKRFSARTMADNYIDAYRSLIARRRRSWESWSDVSPFPPSRA
jgi:glycosyltransferase involved in cell wall biosynthesis